MSGFITPNLLTSERLYDSQGRLACSTVTVINPTLIGFVNTFVTPRDPAQSGSAWVNGGPLSSDSLVTQWLDTTSFDDTDSPYPYTGNYYEPDPQTRTVQTSKPGYSFSPSAPAGTSHAVDITPGYFPAGVNTHTLVTQLGLSVNASALAQQYTAGGSSVFLGNLGVVGQARLQDLLSRPVAQTQVDANGDCLLSSHTYQTGALLGGPNSSVPVMQIDQVYLPNCYAPVSNTQFSSTRQSNALGQLLCETSPDTGTTAYFYDSYNRLRFSQNADQATAGTVIYYLYDALNRLISIGFLVTAWDITAFQTATPGVDASQPPVIGSATPLPLRQLVYDQLPNTSFASSSAGRLVQITSWNTDTNNQLNAASQLIESYQYDLLGRITQVTLQSGDNTYTTSYSYDGQGHVTSIVYPNSQQSAVTYQYTLQGQIKAVGTAANPQYYACYSYNANGQVISESLANDTATTYRDPLVRTYTYGNSLYQLTEITDGGLPDSANHPVFTQTLSYTLPTDEGDTYQDGHIQTVTVDYNKMFGAPTLPGYSFSYSYSYDAFGRLLGVGDTYTQTFDNNGNICSSSDTSATLSLVYTYPTGTDSNNQVSGLTINSTPAFTYHYTDAGRTEKILSATDDSTTFTYDQLLPLPINITLPDASTVQFIYTQNGERFQKITTDTTITYLRGLSANPLVEYQSNSYTNYIYGPLGLICISTDTQSVSDNFLLKDYLGSPTAVYNRQDNDIVAYYLYNSWGKVIATNDQAGSYCRYWYTGQEWDSELALYNYHARQYDPNYLGRFLTPDPAGQFASPYVYCGNNPINATDPTGTTLEDIIEEINARHHSRLFASGSNQWSLTNGQFEEKLAEIEIDASSATLFNVSNTNVAFVGLYNIEQNKIYLHPLEPWDTHYITNDFSPSWRTSPSTAEYSRYRFMQWWYPEFIKPIEHVPGPTTTSHYRIMEKYNILAGRSNSIGFRITKNSAVPREGGKHVINGQSNTLNGHNFEPLNDPLLHKFDNRGRVDARDSYLPDEWTHFLKRGLAKTLPGEIRIPVMEV